MPPIVSTRNGIEATWSRCEWVTKMWSIWDSSASVRSPTPVPASIRMSLSTRNEVVRRWRPPIPPEQHRTRKRMARASLLLVESRHAVPSGRRRVAALFGHDRGVHAVQAAGGIHAGEAPESGLGIIPLPSAVCAQGGIPQFELAAHAFADVGLEAEGLVDRDGLVLPHDLDTVDLAEYHVRHALARRLAREDADRVALGAAFDPGGDVYRIAHRGVGAAHPRAHVADAHRAGIDPDADLQCRPAARGELGVQNLAVLLHVERREHRVSRVLRVLDRRPPERHDRVADVLVERAAVTAADDRAHVGEVLVDVLAQLIGLERLGDASKAAHVGEQDRELGAPRLHVVLGRIAVSYT